MKYYEAAVGIASACVLAYAVGESALKSFDQPDKVMTVEQTKNQAVTSELQRGSKLRVLAGLVEVDAGVGYRRGPAEIDYVGVEMVNGNEVNTANLSVGDLDTLQGPTILVRPFLVRNTEQLDSNDPHEWIGDLEGGKVVWIGIDKADESQIHIYQLPGKNGTSTPISAEITVDKVNNQDGVEFNDGSGEASAGLIRAAKGKNDPYLDAERAIGYHRVADPFVG